LEENEVPKKPKITKEIHVPEWMEVVKSEGDYAIVKIHIGDLERVRLLKLPEEYLAYRREVQRRYRERLKQKKEKI
jgi:hypothetical protein